MQHLLIRQASIVAAVAVVGISAIAATTQPSTKPATQAIDAAASQPATQATAPVPVSASVMTASSLLAEVDAAYRNIKTAQLDGHVTGKFDVAGITNGGDVPFTSSFVAPNRFRHEGDVLIGSTGKNVYSYLAALDAYQFTETPKERTSSDQWPASIMRLLSNQNPSLVLALSKSAADEIHQMDKSPVLIDPVSIDDIACPTLRLKTSDLQVVTLSFDPSSHLLRRAAFDLRKTLEKARATDVKTAEVVIQYTRIDPAAEVAGDIFNWVAPPTAAAASVASDSAAPQLGDSNPKSLVGQPAPDFTLKTLDGKPVKLSEQKGQVVVLDFWATWCGPCVASLPQLDALFKERAETGFKVFAVDLRSSESGGDEAVADFAKKKHLTVTVLLDTDGKVAGRYFANAIPETVIIGKDGIVKKVLIGGGNEDNIRKAVDAASKD